MKKAVKIIAILATIGAIINFIYSICNLVDVIMSFEEAEGIIGSVNDIIKDIVVESFITTTIVTVIGLILLWALYYALSKIEKLEFKVASLKLDFTVHKNSSPVQEKIDVPYCKVCGHEFSQDEKICPKCMAPRGKSNSK